MRRALVALPLITAALFGTLIVSTGANAASAEPKPSYVYSFGATTVVINVNAAWESGAGPMANDDVLKTLDTGLAFVNDHCDLTSNPGNLAGPSILPYIAVQVKSTSCLGGPRIH